MQIRRYKSFKKPDNEKRTRHNEMIRVPEIRLINENGENVGIIKTSEALIHAKELEMDLVEVNPIANPPVCKIIDLGKFKYEQEKLAHKQKIASKKTGIKGVRLSFKIKGGDLENRLNQAKKFLMAGDQVKVELIMKGREKAYADNARKIIEDFMESLKEESTIMQAPQRQGGKISSIIAPK
ncbi:MAG TPA: translation initiation factor IF-3 [bacterium]|nr:translation initiation factor IF-3 [bacterium]